MTLIYLFPGQGSQHVGMGKQVFPNFPELVSAANQFLGYSIERLCLEDPDENLRRTQYTQPAMYVVNALTYYQRLRESQQRPDFVTGHSLGEFNALLAAEVFDFETGLALVRRRGELMGRIEGGGMAAVIGIEAVTIKQILHEFAFDTIDVANYNAPQQTVISGPKRDIEDVEAVFAEVEGCKYVKLNVSGAFHSRYMKEVEDEFERFLGQFEFRAPKIPVIANYSAQPYDAGAMRQTLARQISNPVRWSESIRYLQSQSYPEFKEIGPGTTLSGLLRLNQMAQHA